MNDYDPTELFGWLFEATPEVVDYVLDLESGEPTNRNGRAPYPPDGPIEILASAGKKQAELKRRAADKEFWETM